MVQSRLLASANTGYRAVKRLLMCCLRVTFGGTDCVVTAMCERDLSLSLCVGSDRFVCKHTRCRQGVRALKDRLVVVACKESYDPS